MPGGVCAKQVAADFRAAARCGSVMASLLGIRFSVPLGGFAEAYFPEKSDEELRALAPGETFGVVWERAVFYGYHWILGKVVARLGPGAKAASSASYVQGNSTSGAVSFFPALNRNFLQFTLHIPRFGLYLESKDPVINSAEISELPPYGATYKLERPVRYKPKNAGPFAGMLATTIETCEVKLVELANLKVTLKESSRTASEISFIASVKNDTTEAKISVSWLIWPEESGAEDIKGSLDLSRVAETFTFSVPVAVLREQRWLAVAISKPFTTDAAQIDRFAVES